MRFIFNGINGRYLRDITENATQGTEFVEAAVAYATDASLLFDWCWTNDIPLRFWGRFDETVPVSVNILRNFLNRRSPTFTCKLLRHFHAKVIWWRGYGVYIGSANLTDAAWYRNIEAGCFLDEEEISASGMDVQLSAFFHEVDNYATPLTDEVFNAIEGRVKELAQIQQQDANQRARFLSITSIQQWSGLNHVNRRTAVDRRKEKFLREWFATLQTLRDIGTIISRDENRPSWIPADVPGGSQADQFLHAYYEERVIGEDRRSHFEQQFEQNRNAPEKALTQAVGWWRDTPRQPVGEAKMLLEWAPFLRDELAPERILHLSDDEFEAVCLRVWSIRDHARRVANASLNLPPGRPYDIETKTKALAKFLLSRHAQNGSSVLQVINYVLYDGNDDSLPARLWEATSDGPWRIEHFGLSAIGELVGWALPERFPPRNNRTNKALRALGYSVTVHGAE
jgi:hypothetical protein